MESKILIFFLVATLFSCKKPAAEILNPEPQIYYRAWVSFTDKGDLSKSREARAYDRIEKTFTNRALERRKNFLTGTEIFDDYDLPVYKKYLDELEQIGVELRIQSNWLNGISIVATEEEIQQISQLSFVKEVTDKYIYVKDRSGIIIGDNPGNRDDLDRLPTGFPNYEEQFYGLSRDQVEQLNLHQVHQDGYTGKGIRIGVLDTGFFLDHKAFNSAEYPIKVISQWDLVNNDSVAAVTQDDAVGQHFHGTFILGTLASYVPNELVGNAYEAEYILCKPEDANEEYTLEEKWFVAALEYAEKMGADIITSSLVLYEHYSNSEMDGQTSIMSQGWNIACQKGIIGFQGAGNYGHDQDPNSAHLEVPADAFQVISVGAVQPNDSIAWFSSDGPTADGRLKPEVLSCGNPVYTVSPLNPNLYTISYGTSLATPQMAGAVACLLQAIPLLSVPEIRQMVFESGDYYLEHGMPDPLFIKGYGIPDFGLLLGNLYR